VNRPYKFIKNNNYAFIDGQNLYMGVQRLGWKLDYTKFFKYLSERYKVTTAYLFLGYIKENHNLYQFLQKIGYMIIFRQTVKGIDNNIKGNVDVDLVMKVMTEFNNCQKAIIVTSDGDFYPLIKYLYDKDKLKMVISPYRKTCSRLLRQSAKEKISYLDRLSNKLKLANNKKEASD
jgi:uncharacterized LabA/DUF88 family protein